MKSCLWPRNQFWRFRGIFQCFEMRTKGFSFLSRSSCSLCGDKEDCDESDEATTKKLENCGQGCWAGQEGDSCSEFFPCLFYTTYRYQDSTSVQHSTSAQYSTAHQYSTVHQHNSTQYNTTYRHQDWGTRSRDRGQPLISFFRMNRWTNEQMKRWKSSKN